MGKSYYYCINHIAIGQFILLLCKSYCYCINHIVIGQIILLFKCLGMTIFITSKIHNIPTTTCIPMMSFFLLKTDTIYQQTVENSHICTTEAAFVYTIVKTTTLNSQRSKIQNRRQYDCMLTHSMSVKPLANCFIIIIWVN